MNKNDTTFGGNDNRLEDGGQSSGLTAEGEREASEIKQEIAHTRAEMTGTLDQIHGKLNPTVLKEQAVDQFHEAKEKIKAEIKAELAEAKAAVRGATVGRVENMVHSTTDTVKQTGASLLDTVKRNPIPVAMVGVGAAWLLMRSMNGEARRERARELEPLHEPGSGGEPAAQASRVKRAASARMQASSERVQRFTQDVQERGRQLEYRAEDAFQENPLLIGAAVVAAGALVGLAIPITPREDALMGKTRDGLMERAQGRVQTVLDKAQGAVQRLGSEATRAAGGGNGNLAGGPPPTTR